MKTIVDIKSMFKQKVYAPKNTEVKLIAIFGDVLIVEDKNKNRFSVKKEEVTE